MSDELPRAARLTRENKCVVCEQDIERERFIYHSFEFGGLVHPACHNRTLSRVSEDVRARDLTRIDVENPHAEKTEVLRARRGR